MRLSFHNIIFMGTRDNQTILLGTNECHDYHGYRIKPRFQLEGLKDQFPMGQINLPRSRFSIRILTFDLNVMTHLII